MKDAAWIVGAHSVDGRRAGDFYPTPTDVTQALMNFLDLPTGTTIWEPACGKGDMTSVIRANGYNCIGTDILFGEDFITVDQKEPFDWIITNPPFSIADKFIERAAKIGKPFAFLLKSQYWHAVKRYDLFLNHRPSYVLPLTRRPDFTGKGASLMDVVWVVWLSNNSYMTEYMPLKRPKEEKA